MCDVSLPLQQLHHVQAPHRYLMLLSPPRVTRGEPPSLETFAIGTFAVLPRKRPAPGAREVSYWSQRVDAQHPHNILGAEPQQHNVRAQSVLEN